MHSKLELQSLKVKLFKKPRPKGRGNSLYVSDEAPQWILTKIRVASNSMLDQYKLMGRSVLAGMLSETASQGFSVWMIPSLKVRRIMIVPDTWKPARSTSFAARVFFSNSIFWILKHTPSPSF